MPNFEVLDARIASSLNKNHPPHHMVATRYGDDSPHLSAPLWSSQRRESAWRTGKAVKTVKIQVRWVAAHLDKTVGSRVWWHTQGSGK